MSELILRRNLNRPLNDDEVDANFELLKAGIDTGGGSVGGVSTLATSTADGLMSKEDKTAFDSILKIKSVTGNATFDANTGDLKITGGSSLTQESVYQNLPIALKAIVDNGTTTAISITTKKLFHFDDVSELNTVTKIGNPTLDPVNKVFGQSSLYLDGKSYISIPTTDFASLGYFELSFRVRPRQNGKYWLMSIGSNAIRLSWESSSTGPQLYVGSTNLGFANQIAWDFPMDKFTHLCLRRDKDGAKLYIDGALKLSSTTQTAISASNWYIGANYDGTFKHQVNIDELRLATITYTDAYQVPQNAYIL